MRKLVLAPLSVLTMLTIVVGTLGVRESPSFHSKVPIAGTDPTLHASVGHGFVVLALLLLPLCAILPLCMAWDNIRRKTLAVAVQVITMLAGVGFIFLDSFTGYMIGKMEAPGNEQARGVLLRFKALHVVGFPGLLCVTLVLMWILSVRLASRIRPTPIPPRADSASPAAGSARPGTPPGPS